MTQPCTLHEPQHILLHTYGHYFQLDQSAFVSYLVQREDLIDERLLKI